jgi:hypothetical protein
MTPQDAATVSASNVTVTFQTLNFRLVRKLSQPNVADEGHLHYFMDADAPTAPEKLAVTAPGTYAATENATYTWTNVKPGLHTFSVELVNNNHTPLVPPVVSKSTVIVNAPAPEIKIITPANRTTLSAGSVAVSVKVSNFNLVNKLGAANV